MTENPEVGVKYDVLIPSVEANDPAIDAELVAFTKKLYFESGNKLVALYRSTFPTVKSGLATRKGVNGLFIIAVCAS